MIAALIVVACWILLAALVAPLVGRGIRNGQQGDLVEERHQRAEAMRRHPAGRDAA